MKKLKKNILIFLFLLLSWPLSAFATTYYIAASGSDSANGTSKSTPWAHCPGMGEFDFDK